MFSYIIALGVLLFAPLTQANAHSDKRHAKAHEHGTGKLSIAIENDAVSLTLEVPGADILGFEHVAKTEEQKASVEKAKATLANTPALFSPDNASDCKVVTSKVDLKNDDNKNEAEGHSEFEVTSLWKCKAGSRLTRFTFEYFNIFPYAQKLEVVIVMADKQSQYVVSRKKPDLTLRNNS